MVDARARAEELREWNLFITMTDEEGDGEVVAVKDLVDVRGTPTSAGSVLLPRDVKADDAPQTIERILQGYLAHRASPQETFLAFARRHEVDELKLMFDAEAAE